MQPIVFKIANSVGVSDYVDGLVPDFVKEEDFANLIAFGDQNETLLKVALNSIIGLPLTAVASKSKQLGLKKIFDSQSIRPFSKQMYINKFTKN